jgi:DNA (cytosine-5)-methyltransferase 1
MKKLKVVDLFSGAGGFSEGFHQAGFEVVAAVDNDEKALAAHEHNHPETEHYLIDVTKEDIAEILADWNADVVIGSPPCKKFSNANPARNWDEGMELVDEFFRVIDELDPKYWVGENVPPSQKPIEDKYHTSGYLLNAANFGAPQTRHRYFFGNFPRPKGN